MNQTNKLILTTRPLPREIIAEAAQQSITIEELSFIGTQPIETDEVTARIRKLADEQHTVVFTSMNAVTAVEKHAKKGYGWQVYCIGTTTEKLIKELLPQATIIATAENAERLGERMIDDGVNNMVFFCGTMRRDELPNKFRSEGKVAEEVVVYQTLEQPSVINKTYDGILFYSPSAVHSFFKINKTTPATTLFAIGKTTAEAIREHKNQKIQVANVTSKIELAREAIAFFQAKIKE